MVIRRLSDDEYKNCFSLTIRTCVDIVIKTDKGILLGIRNIEPYAGLWHLPGGMHYKGELATEAAKRIAKVETGLDIEVVKMLGIMEFPNEVQSDFHYHSQSVAYLAKFVGGDIKSDFQSSKLEYFKKIPKDIHNTHKKFLEDHWKEIMN